MDNRPNCHPPRARDRRGIAMLMVVIALVVTSVLTMALLTAPDTTRPIAKNAVDAAEARWSAESAANFTTAAIEKKIAATAIGGVFLDNYGIAGGDADVMVTNAAGDPPTADDHEIIVTINAKAGGMRRTIQRRVTLKKPFDITKGFDTRMGEVALFANGSADLDEVRLGKWALSPEAASGEARLFINAESVSDLNLDDLILDGSLAVPAMSSSSVSSFVQASKPDGFIELPYNLPVGSVSLPDYSDVHKFYIVPALPIIGLLPIIALPGMDFELPPGRYDRIGGGKHWVIRLTDGTYVFDKINVRPGARIIIEGDARIIVRQDFHVRPFGQVQVGPNGSAHVYVGERFHVKEGLVGPWEMPQSNSQLTEFEAPFYMSPARFRVDLADDAEFTLKEGSLFHGDVHGPFAEAEIYDSTLIGRITTARPDIERSMLLYDPALDPRTGFFTMDGPLYTAEGEALPGLDDVIDDNFETDSGTMAKLMLNHVVDYWDGEGQSPTSASGYTRVKYKKVAVSAFSAEGAGGVLSLLNVIAEKTGAELDDVLGKEKALVEEYQ